MKEDHLLASLVNLTRVLGQPTSEGTLLAGLPTEEKKLTIDLFPRAASHVNLTAKLKQVKLKKRPIHFSIPVVLLLEDDKATLLTDITSRGTVKLINPDDSDLEDEIPFEELMQHYSGEAFVVEPDPRYITQGTHVTYEGKNKAWFWNSIGMLWSSYSEVIVASFLINVFALAVPLFTMNVYDKIIPNRIFDSLWVLASGIFIVFTFDLVMRVLRSYFIDQAGKMVDQQVSANILERVMGIKMTERPRSVGAFANTIQSFDSVRDFVTSSTVTVLVDLPFSILFILIVGLIGGDLVFVPLLLLPLTILFGLLLQKPLTEYTKIANRHSAEKQAILLEILNGIETVKTTGSEHVMQSKWEQIVHVASTIGIKLRFLVNLGIFFSIFIQQLAVVLVVIVGVYKITGGSLTLGGLIACSILSSRALAPMAQIAALLTRYHQTKNSIDTLNTVMNLPLETPMDRSVLDVPDLDGAIEFRNVSFQFPGQTHDILHQVSFKLAPGERVGIIGRVGSGKTTLAKLILGLLQPTDGSILFDGVDQSHYNISELRKNIGYVPQDITLFYGTLRDNITLGAPHVEDSKIVRAIDVSGIDEFVKPQLGSYESLVNEAGKNLSGGQRQIIAIARAVLLDPPIIVFDEPSNSMDNQTENAIKAKLDAYLNDKTFVLMTHHPSLLTLVTRVIILDAGKIVVDGPKEKVLQALSEGKIKIQKV